MGACVSRPDGCIGGHRRSSADGQKRRKRRRVGKRQVSSKKRAMETIDEVGDGVDRLAFDNPTFQKGSIDEAWFETLVTEESDCDDDYHSVQEETFALHGFDGDSSIPISSSFKDANHEDIDPHQKGHKLAGQFRENPDNSVNKHFVTHEDISSLSMAECASKEEGGVLDTSGSVLPNNCLPCITTAIATATTEKKKSFTSSPPNSAKKATLKLSFKRKPCDGRTFPEIYSSKYVLERPLAGSQIPFCQLEKKMSNSWARIDPCTFRVRGENYIRDKKKEFAQNHAAYYPFGVDVYLSQQKINHIARFVELPGFGGKLSKSGMADESYIVGSSEKDVEIGYVKEQVMGEDVVDANPNPEPDSESNFDQNTLFSDQNKCRNDPIVDNETPRVGMVFKTFEEVYGFYNQYARKIGFGTKIRRSWYSLDDGQCNKFMLTCCKEGRREYKNSERCSSYRLRLSARTDCQARIKVIKRYADGLFHLTEVILEHNHPVNPSMSQFFRSHRGVNDSGKKMPVMRVKGNRELASVENEGESSIGKAQTSFLGRDDVEALHQFFARMQSTNTNFFYLINLDEDGRLRHVFWADGRCKAEYQYFGDVVTLDTTYLVNNYETPLVTFVGTNHHGHSILFGCALLSDRSAETYRWLFKSWLSCMSGSPPNAIITDNCKAMQEAVAEVFPGARHRMCLCHIMKRMQENLAGYAEYKAIKETMKRAVHDSVRVEEYEEEWRNMIETYGLEDNEWLKSMYENRHNWVPVFVKESFWAGMSNIRHKENVTSFFDGYIYPKTSLKQFLCKYEATLQSKYEKEVQADLDSFNKSPQLISKFYMEDQLRKIYTVDMFKKFQEEVKAILYCNTALVRVDGPFSIFEVKEPLRMKDGNQMENKDYEVTYNSNEQDVQCICCYFQSMGILCRHTLSVLNFLEVYEIPPQFIVDRWRKDYKHRHGLAYSLNDLVANGPMERHDNLYKRCLRFVELGVLSDEHYEYALKLISDVTEELITNDCTMNDMLPRNASSISGKSIRNDDNDIHDFAQLRQKGQLPKKRKDSLAEKAVKSIKKKASQRKSVIADQNDDLLHVGPDTPQFDSHIWTQDSINLTEQVSPTNLSIGNHFGMQLNHPHALDNQSGIRWSFQQMFQQAHTPEAPPGPWTG